MKYKSEISALNSNATLEEREAIASKYGYNPSIAAQLKCTILDCVETDGRDISFTVKMHSEYDLAVLIFNNAKANKYSDYAIFAKDSAELRRGDFLCRYGYPFAEFSDYEYDDKSDDIIWSKNGRAETPSFPIEGMYTRSVIDSRGCIFEYELSTPGLRGQSGGPLFDENGIVFGMQSETFFLHLGFDQEKAKVRINGQLKEVDNHPFLHVGRCLSVDVIKSFLTEIGIKYYVGDSTGMVEVINGMADNTSLVSQY